MDIITRKEALAQGLPRYRTGRPCKRGHVADRLTSNLTCVECDKEKRKSDPWHRRSPENFAKHNARSAAWSAANADKVRAKAARLNAMDETKARKAAWYQENRDRIRAEQTERNRERSSENVERARAWKDANPDRARELSRLARSRRRARIKGAGGDHTTDDLAAILKAQKGCCAYCRAKLSGKKHVDHIIPLARGGSNGRANLQYLCRPCNQSKSAKDPIAFAQERGLLL